MICQTRQNFPIYSIFNPGHFPSSNVLQAMHATADGEMRLLEPVDDNENTVAHLAVKRGHMAVFKVRIML